MAAVLISFAFGAAAAFAIGPLALAFVTLVALIAWFGYAMSSDYGLANAAMLGFGAWVASQAGYFTVVMARSSFGRTASSSTGATKQAAVQSSDASETHGDIPQDRPLGVDHK